MPFALDTNILAEYWQNCLLAPRLRLSDGKSTPNPISNPLGVSHELSLLQKWIWVLVEKSQH